MPYSQRFVVSVLVNDQVREEKPDGSVIIPFGVEYALKFRNKHRDRRAIVKLFIDGEEQSKGGYVIPPNSAKIIERNSHSPHKFKFVAPNSTAAQEWGKDRYNTEGFNGVIEARFYLEKEQPVQEIHHHHHYPIAESSPAQYSQTIPPPRERRTAYFHQWNTDNRATGPGGSSAMGFSMKSSAGRTCNSNMPETLNFCDQNREMSPPPNCLEMAKSPTTITPGVTVEGSHSSQTFVKINLELENDFVPIKVILKGYKADSEKDEYYDGDVVVAEAEVSKKK